MRKIITGVIGIILTLTVAGGVAYAAFTSQASVLGVAFNSGTAYLKVWNSSIYTDSWDSGWNFSGLYPGYNGEASPKTFWLKNDSNVAINLAVTGKLRDGVTGDWSALSPYVQVAIRPVGDGAGLVYHTLAQWNTPGGYPIDGGFGAIAQGIERQYNYYVKVDPLADSSIASKSLTGVNFDFTGTQNP